MTSKSGIQADTLLTRDKCQPWQIDPANLNRTHNPRSDGRSGVP